MASTPDDIPLAQRPARQETYRGVTVQVWGLYETWTIVWPENPLLHGKVFRDEGARAVIDWQLAGGHGPCPLPGYTALRPTGSPVLPGVAPAPLAAAQAPIPREPAPPPPKPRKPTKAQRKQAGRLEYDANGKLVF